MLNGLGVVGHKYGDLFVIEQGNGKNIRSQFRVGSKGEWMTWLPTFVAVCKKDHTCEYTITELYKHKCKQCEEK